MPAAPNIHAWIMHRAILKYLESLTVTQGPKRGEPFEVLPWERRFVRGAFGVEDDVALSMGRGGGKTTFVAALACAIRDPDGPLHEKASRMSPAARRDRRSSVSWATSETLRCSPAVAFSSCRHASGAVTVAPR